MISDIGSTREKVKIILKKLLEEYILSAKKSGTISLQMDQFFSDTNLDRFDFLKVLANLKERNLVTSFLLRKGPKVRHEANDKQDFDTCGIAVTSNFHKGVEKYIGELSENSTKETGLILYLDKNGDLWHGNKNNNCYKMGKDTIPYKIIRFLAENNGLQNTEVIASMLGDKKKRAVMNDIGEMRAKIKHQLQLDDVILNEKPFGYHIDPKYKIVITD
jgi:hypothetical protein